MNNILPYLLSTLAGGGLGAIFYLGLWWTVRAVPNSDYPGLLITSSFLVRSALVLGGFFLLVTAHVLYLGAAFAGFLLARLLITRWKRPRAPGEPAESTGGAS